MRPTVILRDHMVSDDLRQWFGYDKFARRAAEQVSEGMGKKAETLDAVLESFPMPGWRNWQTPGT